MVLSKMKKNLKGVKAMYKRLVDFFSVYDENNIFHNGFLQSINLSAYTDITFLNEITLNLMDAFLKNEIGNMLTSSKWSKLLEWDKTEKRYIIKSKFYNNATDSIYAYLIRGNGLYTLMDIDFRSLSASETEQIVYGEKEELKDYDTVVLTVNRDDDSTVYGQEERTLEYGLHEIETEYGQLQRTLHYGQHVNSTEYGNTTETTNIGQQINSSENINKTHPYDMNDFLDNTKDTRTDTNGTRQDTKNTPQHTDTNTSGVHEDSDTTATRTDTSKDNQHTDKDITASKTDVNKYGDITNTTDSRQDKNTIKTHTDQKTRTKVILIPPEKYFEIQKELLLHNVYDIMKDCVKECFTIHSF